MIAEADLARAHTRMGMAVAKRRLRGKQPKLKPRHEAHVVELWNNGSHTTAQLAELFSVGPSTGSPHHPKLGTWVPARRRSVVAA